MAVFKDYIDDISGATAVEYGLMVGILAIATIIGGKAVGGSLNNRFGDVGNSVTEAGLAEGSGTTP